MTTENNENCTCGCEKHTHNTDHCGCGCENHAQEQSAESAHQHNHTCGCGCKEHEHSKATQEHCSCGGEKHEHNQDHCECGCEEHKHEHHHDSCGCGCCDDDCCDDDECCCCCCGNSTFDVSKVPEKGLTEKQKKKLTKVIVAFIALVIIKLLEPIIPSFWANVVGLNEEAAATASYFTNIFLYGADYIYIGNKVLKSAFRNILKGRVFDENFLMVVATLGAVFMGIMGDGEFTEAVAVMVFFQLGAWFEDYAIGRSRKNITDLMDIRPDYANVEKSGQLEKVDPASLEIGSIIIVQPGEKIPLDGIVVEGSSSIDTSALTGESVPRTANVGDEVISGCICSSGVLKIKTTKHFSESTVSKILKLVETSSERKSHSEAFISRFAKVYTPAVCIAALCLALIPPIVITAVGESANWLDWVYRALTFLVISCPCALVISIPLSFFAGIGCAGKNGVLVKGSNYLEALSKLDTVVFDKTGTLTQGVFKFVDVTIADDKALEGIKINEKLSPQLEFDEEQRKLLVLAAYAESASSHPIAKSIVATLSSPLDRSRLENQSETSAQGVQADVLKHTVKVGKPGFTNANAEAVETASTQGSTVYVSVDDTFVGTITIADVVKETSARAISELKREGVRKTVMLTGDNQGAAEFVASQIGIDEVHASLLPENKVEEVERIQETKSDAKSNIAFVGDGINDAPVLMRADVGIAMGAMGSDAAIEAADVVLMDDNPLSISKAVIISRKAMRIVRENIVFALGIKAACLILGAVGIATMYLAIFADVGVMVLAVLNAMRALRIKA